MSEALGFSTTNATLYAGISLLIRRNPIFHPDPGGIVIEVFTRKIAVPFAT
jgi:hypothetical protein